MTAISRRSTGLIAGFLGWTLFVWGIVRVRNILGDDALSVAERNKALLLSASFWIPAVVLAVAVVTTLVQKATLGAVTRAGLLALAGWSVLVWIFRIIGIAFTSDRGFAFIAVHVVLGVISIVLAALVASDLGVRFRGQATSQA